MNRKHYAATFVTALLLLTAGPAVAEPSAAFNFVAHLDGTQEVPLRETSATGQTTFQLDTDGTALSYKLIVANIENVVAAHIHLAIAGINGPVVAFLAGPFAPGEGRLNGVIAEGTITADDLVGPLVGMQLSVLLEAMRTDGTYVNVHTNDGIDPANSGPGDFPGGEVRGQIMAAGSR
ncbi:CHRD domain-containing protein [Marinobacterium aestuariivivens]|uniref:CHRD domain-containing protein n=1 Tax=Marinobacterium aestuariivivens TaxID=1698799 RepID=A0ABW1ZW85_9GAMM